MNRGYLPFIALAAYLLLSLGPWLVLQAMRGLVAPPGRDRDDEEERLGRIAAVERAESLAWPPAPRPGPFAEPDRLARQELDRLSSDVEQVGAIWQRLEDAGPPSCHIVDALFFRCWGALAQAIRASRDARQLAQALARAEASVRVLQEQRRVVEEMPQRVRAELNQLRAETNHLTVLLEAEQEAGTRGLEDVGKRLADVRGKVGAALDRLAEADEAALCQVILDVDGARARWQADIAQTHELVIRTGEERTKARQLAERVVSSQGLARERWEALRQRGVTEPAIARALDSLRASADDLSSAVIERSVQAYHRVGDGAEAFELQFEQLMGRMDALLALAETSREALEGAAEAASRVRELCDEVVSSDSRLEPDVGRGLLQQAEEALGEAGQQWRLGTLDGYERARQLAEAASERLLQEEDVVAAMPERVRRLVGLGTWAERVDLGRWRERVDRLAQELGRYTHHWKAGLETQVQSLRACLDQADAELHALPPHVREQRSFRQSELDEVMEGLARFEAAMARAEETLAELFQEAERLGALREELSEALLSLRTKTLPAFESLLDKMLPELRDRAKGHLDGLGEQMAMYADLGIDHDQAVREWLPAVQQELDALWREHEQNVQYYQEALGEAVGKIDRQWARLSRLAPQEPPGPEEDVHLLAEDLDVWRSEGQRNLDSPVALREIIRQGPAFEQRIEAMRAQVAEGRRALTGARRRYQWVIQSLHDLRRDIQKTRDQSQWSHLEWELGEAQRSWEKAIAFERSSQGAETLVEAHNALQQGLSAAQQALQLYRRAERQILSGLRRLDGERRRLEGALGTQEQAAEKLRQQGDMDGATKVYEVIRDVRQLIRTAENAASFEDALRHLRQGENRLASME